MTSKKAVIVRRADPSTQGFALFVGTAERCADYLTGINTPAGVDDLNVGDSLSQGGTYVIETVGITEEVNAGTMLNRDSANYGL